MKEMTIEGKNVFTQDQKEVVEKFFKDYDYTSIDVKERYKGMLSKNVNALSKSKLRRIWNRFIQYDRINYLGINNLITMEDIVRIGIDKFVVTNGWSTPNDVQRWRRNKVRLGVCPHCKNQFIPLMFQVNSGLCKNCRAIYSTKAIRKYIDYIGSTNERYQEAEYDILMDFFILFYADEKFRNLFIKGSEFAKEFENKEFEVADWLKEAKVKNASRKGVIDVEGVEVESD